MTHQVIYHSDEQVEEERRAAMLHFHLHRATTFERVATADDEGEVVSAKLGVTIRRVCVRISSGRKDRAALDARLFDVVSIWHLLP